MLRKLIVLVVIAGIAAGLYIQDFLQKAETRVVTEQARNITVAKGASMRGFAEQLTDEGLLEEKWSFIFWSRYRELSSSLKTGEYLVPAGATMNELLKLVTSGQVIDYPITFIEGWSFKQLRSALSQQKQLTHIVDEVSDQEIMKQLGAQNVFPEGRFYPDTYHYTASMTDLDILRQAYKKMIKVLDEQWNQREEGLPLKSSDEALTLASIIEKETGAVEERPLIAGVFTNRLRKGMLLQTDPTVIYGMGENYKGNIRRSDLRKDTPYNTYTRKGLPPTPIAMPGTAAIKAALHPAVTKALYFVAKGDGTHYFSATLREHNNAVNKYQIKRRKDYRSSKK